MHDVTDDYSIHGKIFSVHKLRNPNNVRGLKAWRIMVSVEQWNDTTQKEIAKISVRSYPHKITAGLRGWCKIKSVLDGI